MRDITETLQTNLEIRVDLPTLISCDLVDEDLRNKRYYYWTEHNRRMRMVDMSQLNVEDSKVQAIHWMKCARRISWIEHKIFPRERIENAFLQPGRGKAWQI